MLLLQKHATLQAQGHHHALLPHAKEPFKVQKEDQERHTTILSCAVEIHTDMYYEYVHSSSMSQTVAFVPANKMQQQQQQ